MNMDIKHVMIVVNLGAPGRSLPGAPLAVDTLPINLSATINVLTYWVVTAMRTWLIKHSRAASGNLCDSFPVPVRKVPLLFKRLRTLFVFNATETSISSPTRIIRHFRLAPGFFNYQDIITLHPYGHLSMMPKLPSLTRRA